MVSAESPLKMTFFGLFKPDLLILSDLESFPHSGLFETEFFLESLEQNESAFERKATIGEESFKRETNELSLSLIDFLSLGQTIE